MSSYNSAVRKKHRCFHKIKEHLLFGTCIVNPWFAFKSNIRPWLQHQYLVVTNFKEKLCMDLIGVSDEEPSLAVKQAGHHYLKYSLWDKEETNDDWKLCVKFATRKSICNQPEKKQITWQGWQHFVLVVKGTCISAESASRASIYNVVCSKWLTTYSLKKN